MTRHIYILTGPVHSGKTTKLLQWMEKRNDVAGILSPVANGKIFFMNAATRETFEMEAADEMEDILRVGRYVFNKKSFDKATNILQQALLQQHGWLVLDEVGPLELKGKGFSDAVRQVIAHASADLKLIFVVREGLVEEFLRIFQIGDEHYQVVDVTSEIFD